MSCGENGIDERELPKIRHDFARLALGMISSDAWDNLPQINRLAKISGQQEIMHTVSSLSKTSQDEENGGLPRRTIFTLDARNSKCKIFFIMILPFSPQ